MNRLRASKAKAAEELARAVELVLRSPAAVGLVASRTAETRRPMRYGKRARPVPLTRFGKANR